MNKNIHILLISCCMFLLSCSNSDNLDNIVREWVGREFSIPDNVIFITDDEGKIDRKVIEDEAKTLTFTLESIFIIQIECTTNSNFF